MPDSGYDSIPALLSRATPLTTASANGGYLDGTALKGYLPALQAQCNLVRLGATLVQLDKGSTTIPRGVAPIVTTWQPDQVTPTVATAPTLGSLVFQRKDTLTSVTLSRQQLLQSDAELTVPLELQAALGAAFDRQGIQGTGLSGTPLGILNMQAISTASGASLAYSSVVTQMTNVAGNNAIVDPDSLGFFNTSDDGGFAKAATIQRGCLPDLDRKRPQRHHRQSDRTIEHELSERRTDSR